MRGFMHNKKISFVGLAEFESATFGRSSPLLYQTELQSKKRNDANHSQFLHNIFSYRGSYLLSPICVKYHRRNRV